MKVYAKVRFVETQYRGVDFPPSSFKLMQAIIASSQSKYMDVLRLLETQAPVIYAVTPISEFSYARYVINNDESLQHANTGTKKTEITRRFNDADAHVVFEYDVPAELLSRFT